MLQSKQALKSFPAKFLQMSSLKANLKLQYSPDE